MGTPKAASTEEDKEPYFKVRVPSELMDQLRITCARRKEKGEKPNTQQAIGLAALLNYFDPDNATNEESAALTDTIALLELLVRQSAAKLRHFGHRDASTGVLHELVDLGFKSGLQDIESGESEDTKRS